MLKKMYAILPWPALLDRSWPSLPCLVNFMAAAAVTAICGPIDSISDKVEAFLVLAFTLVITGFVLGILCEYVANAKRYNYSCVVFDMWPFEGRYHRSHALYQFNTLAGVLAGLAGFSWVVGGTVACWVLLAAMLAAGLFGNRVRARLCAISLPVPQGQRRRGHQGRQASR